LIKILEILLFYLKYLQFNYNIIIYNMRQLFWSCTI